MAAGLGSTDEAVGVYINNFSRGWSAFSSRVERAPSGDTRQQLRRPTVRLASSLTARRFAQRAARVISSSLSNGELLSLIILSAY
jgi:hypothetical protein